MFWGLQGSQSFELEGLQGCRILVCGFRGQEDFWVGSVRFRGFRFLVSRIMGPGVHGYGSFWGSKGVSTILVNYGLA